VRKTAQVFKWLEAGKNGGRVNERPGPVKEGLHVLIVSADVNA